MTHSLIQNSFTGGEISPSLFGRTDLAKWHNGASTQRNFYTDYRGGASSRAGLAYVGMCKQGAANSGGTSTTNPPRDIPFQFNVNQGYVLEFGDQYMRVKYRGAYVIESGTTISAATNANPLVITDTAHGYSNGDWVYISGVGGMTQLNGLTFIVTAKTTNTYELTDLFGTTINSTSYGTYTSGGTAARIYTAVSPYAAVDIPYLKYAQSANTMSLCCVNQQTLTDYPPYDLTRVSNTNWTFTAVTFASSIAAPTGASAGATSSTTTNTSYNYVVTAVTTSGEESIASNVAAVKNNDIAVNAGTNSITWTSVTGAASYNIYAATPIYVGSGGVSTIPGVLYGYLGTATGTAFIDTNIVADFTKVPPQHQNPFSGTGNYPSVVAYYQQRRFYANTLNNPDTYYASQPGAFLNMDYSIPISDGDSITGTPWAQQINGIQFMQPMTNGLIILTGNGAWVLNGGNNAAITPADQTATAQAYNGCNPLLPPLVINYDILYVQSKGSIVRDLAYNFFVNIFTGTDKTILSNHLFDYHQIKQWCYAEEPYKNVWAVRNDGILLSFTYLKEQDVYAWARHDTDGLIVGVTSVTEPPVDAVYVIVQRYIRGNWVYYSERMDNRNWIGPEDAFCVDAGLTYPLSYPNATLSPVSATGTNNITSVTVAFGGTGYTSPTATAVDPTGKGSGATFTVTSSGGVITSITVTAAGTNYAQGTQIVINDSTGSGALANAVITNNVTFNASSSVFTSGMVGQVIRIGNSNAIPTTAGTSINGTGKAIITSYVSGTQVVANITVPITATLPNDPTNTPIPVLTGQWSLGIPTTTVSGLNHLEGKSVAIVGDGSVQPSQTVTNGAVTLPIACSAITVGLPYVCQLQTLYLEPPGPETAQDKRKTIQSIYVRVKSTRGLQAGTNQVDQSTLPNNYNVVWNSSTGMKELKENAIAVTSGLALPLYTGDSFINLPVESVTAGQAAIQQSFPMPANISAIVSRYVINDTSSG